MILVYFAFVDALDGEHMDFWEKLLARIFAGLLFILAVTEFVGEIYGLAVLIHFCVTGWGQVA